MKSKRKKINKIKGWFRKIFQNINGLYIGIMVIIAFGVGLLINSSFACSDDTKNILVGLGTGVVTSALVTLYIDIINTRIGRKKVMKYKRMLLNPLYKATKNLYVYATQNINEYRVREELEGYFLLPIDDMGKISDFFEELKSVNVQEVENDKRKKRLEIMLDVPLVLYSELLSQYKGIPFESLLLDNIITQDEYDKMKYFSIVNECVKTLNLLNQDNMSEQETYCMKIQIMYGMYVLMNRIMRTFDFISQMAKTENEWIKEQLDYLWYNEIYVNSDEYIENLINEMSSRAEAEAEYYAEHPELYEDIEEDEEDILHRKINTAIWSGDAETIKQCFPDINANNKQIQSELTWSLAKDVMRDKELRKMYYEKYGVKYKVRKDKKRHRKNFK